MKRNSSLALLVLVALFVTGCSNHEAAIEKRFMEGAGHLCRGDVDACIPLVDPVFVRAQGTGKVKLALGAFSLLFNIGQLTEADIRVDRVEIGPNGKTAQVHFSLLNKVNGEWTPAKNPSKWVRSDGQWYLAF